jgi:hypothetical protein
VNFAETFVRIISSVHHRQLQRELKTLAARNHELESQLNHRNGSGGASGLASSSSASSANSVAELKAQLRKQHQQLTGAVRRIHWLLFERTKVYANSLGAIFESISSM